MTFRGRSAVALGVLAAAVGGCGESDETTSESRIPAGSAEEQIASTVNEMFAAWNAGDGELACSLMTERGQELAVRIARQWRQLDGSISLDDCVEAVAQTAGIANGPIGQVVQASQVHLNGRDRATVASEYRGELSMKQVDGQWLVVVPAFLD